MSKESRTVALSGLTLLIFALIGFLKDGSIIFPFPLNEIIFLIVVVQFVYWHYKKGALPYYFLLSAITGVIGTQFFWEIFMPHQQLEVFMGYSLVHWCRLLSKVFLLIAGIYFINSLKEWYFKVGFTAGLILISFGVISNDHKFLVIGLLAIFIINSLKAVHKPFHLIWTLLLILEGSKWLSFLLAIR